MSNYEKRKKLVEQKFGERTDEDRQKRRYPICLEISGKLALFVDPTTGGNRSSYPIAPKTQSKGIFETIKFMPTVIVEPYKIEICKPIRYESYSFNYHGHLSKQKRGDIAYQIRCSILRDVCYRIYAYVYNNYEFDSSKILKQYKNVNHAHSYQWQFYKRLMKNQNLRTASLGKSDFLCSYCGIFREDTVVENNINFIIPSFVAGIYDKKNMGTKLSPSFVNNIEIRNGVMYYDK
jgi:CRISPR-associated Cas5-like protein